MGLQGEFSARAKSYPSLPAGQSRGRLPRWQAQGSESSHTNDQPLDCGGSMNASTPRRLILAASMLCACGRSNVYSETTGGSTAEASTSAGSTRGTSAATGSSRSTASSGTQTSSGQSASSAVAGTGTTLAAATDTNGTGSTGATGTAAVGTTTTGGTTTGTQTSGSTSGAACNPSLPANELQTCNGSSDCGCPLNCVASPFGVSLCERSCLSLSDCPDLETLCTSGECQPNACGSGFDGTLDSDCNVVATNDGSCLPSTIGTLNVGLCSQGGPEDVGCSPTATRATIAQACIPGDFCAAALESVCAPLCDPFAFESCGLTATCTPLAGQDPRLGVCEPKGTTGTTSGSTTGVTSGTSSGTTSGSTGNTGTSGATTGTTSGGSTSGSCSTTVTPSEFETCQNDLDCGCPLTCTRDLAAGGQVCEYPCLDTSDCANLFTTCQNGFCSVNQCGGNTGNGTFDSTCNVLGTNDGTCEPLTLNDGISSVGYCVQAGSAAGNCDPSASRITPASQICPAGELCFGGVETFGGTCNQLCNPQSGSCTDQSQFCSAIVNEPDLGICIDGF
jgi:hypothetical protein